MNTKFSKDIESTVTKNVMDMDSYDLEEYFDTDIDYAMLDSINDIDIDSFEIEDEDEEKTVSGMMTVDITIEGFTHWDGENHCIDSSEIQLCYSFDFEVEKDECSDLELEYIF